MKGDPKIVKNRVFARYDNKLNAHNAVRFDNWVGLQKLSHSYYVKADGSIDSHREKKLVKTFRGILSIKIINDLSVKLHNTLHSLVPDVI